MPRRKANITQADVARIIRAAKQQGAPAVEVRPDGTILVRLTEPAPGPVDSAAQFAAYDDVPL
jgi:hypothetical protein